MFILPAGGEQPTAGIQIARSLRFNNWDNVYLSRTPGVAGNRDTMTFHCWVKHSVPGVSRTLFAANTSSSNYSAIKFGATGQFSMETVVGGSTVMTAQVNNVYSRDPTAWSVVTVAIDSTTNSYRAWVGDAELTWTFTIVPAAGTDTWFNHTVEHRIGKGALISQEFSGHMANVHFIDGLALDYTAFLVQDPATGVWMPKAYTGAYGTNGFKLTFSDNSAATAAALGANSSGNGNNYTPTNISVAAGIGNDSSVDSPTNYGTDTGAGGEVRGNYCVWGQHWPFLSAGGNGGLDSQSAGVAVGTMALLSFDAYWEITSTGGVSTSGVISESGTTNTTTVAAGKTYGFRLTTAGALDYKNITDAGAWTAITTGLAGVQLPYTSGAASTVASLNAGQRAFAATAPTGFKCLCTQNLSVSSIKRGDNYMTVNLRTGTAAVFSVTGKRFRPDIVWAKTRSHVFPHVLYDSSRGVNNELNVDATAAEAVEAQGVAAFNADGFSGGSLSQLNGTTATFVDWLWKTGAASGIDIVLYTGNNTPRTIIHGLGAVPTMMIVKNRTTTATPWVVYHASLPSPASAYLVLSDQTPTGASVTAWNNTAPTSSVFSVGASAGTNSSGDSMVAYLFRDISGFSKFGTYTGNGNSDGPFVHTGFKPRWIMHRGPDTNSAWVIADTTRSPLNPTARWLSADVNSAEASSGTAPFDILSNGFKLRSSVFGGWNTSAAQYIYAAFAETPFKYARAR